MNLTSGFANPVSDAQTCFRAILNAMSRPGLVQCVQDITAPAPLAAATAAVLLTLADHETPAWLDHGLRAASSWITFHTGAAIVDTTDAPTFVVALTLPHLAALPTGSDETPEIACTVILQVQSLAAGQHFILTGPGIRHTAALTVSGLPANFTSIWQSNNALFPRGVDLILCAGNSLAALPRGITVKDA